MMVAGASLSAVSLGSVMQDPGAITDPTLSRAILTEINGVDVRDFVLMNSLSIEDTLGAPATATFTLETPTRVPVEGDAIRILYFSQVIFAGMIDRVRRSTEGLAAFYYQVECKDWSQILERRYLRRNFTNVPISTILQSLLENELAGEPLTIGTIDYNDSLPLVDSQAARIMDVLRTIAGATGQTFYVDFDKSIQMRNASVPILPFVLSESVVEVAETTLQSDRETYRNHQIVKVTGTPPAGGGDALIVSIEASNVDQIAARRAIEGGSGIYDGYEEITHPTSNLVADLNLLGTSYANLRLANFAVIRQTVNCTVRSYGIRAGQIAAVALTTFGIVGEYVIQRVRIAEQDGANLVHMLELTSSSAQQRAFEAWMKIIETGQCVVQVLGIAAVTRVEFLGTGAQNWVVPAGVTVITITAIGGSGSGGSGGRLFRTDYYGNFIGTTDYYGGWGGSSGRAVSNVNVVAGQQIDIIVGGKGTPGGSPKGQYGYSTPMLAAYNGDAGEDTVVSRAGVSLAEGWGGGGGQQAGATAPWAGYSGANGTVGGGSGGNVTPGGGKTGGAGSVGPNYGGSVGQDGYVTIEY